MKYVGLFLYMILSSGPLWAQNPCGAVNSSVLNVPIHYALASEANFDGSTLAPPAQGSTYTDPQYGCTMTRLTNGPTEFSAAGRHEYANETPMNITDTMVALWNPNAGTTWFITDLTGNYIVPPGNMPCPDFSMGPRWSTRTTVAFPSTFYCVLGSGNVIKQGVVASACAPSCTITYTTLHTFTEYSTVNFGSGEGDISWDGDHLAIEGICNGTGTGACNTNGNAEFFVYTISTDTKGPVFNYGTHPLDNVQITKGNKLVANWGPSGSSCSSGPCFFGFENFGAGCTGIGCSPANNNYVSHFLNADYHSKQVFDPNTGTEYTIIFDENNETCVSGACISRVQNSNGAILVLTNLISFSDAGHVSASDTGWVEVSTNSVVNPGDASWPSLKSTWQTDWKVLDNECILYKLDGSSSYRVVQHRARNKVGAYNQFPKATLTRDGKYLIYDSDFEIGNGTTTPVTDYTDVYMLTTGLSGSANTGSLITPGIKISAGVSVQ